MRRGSFKQEPKTGSEEAGREEAENDKVCGIMETKNANILVPPQSTTPLCMHHEWLCVLHLMGDRPKSGLEFAVDSFAGGAAGPRSKKQVS